MSFRRTGVPTEMYPFVVKIKRKREEWTSDRLGQSLTFEISKWIAENCRGEHMLDDSIYWDSIRKYRFELKEDAALFMLFWNQI